MICQDLQDQKCKQLNSKLSHPVDPQRSCYPVEFSKWQTQPAGSPAVGAEFPFASRSR